MSEQTGDPELPVAAGRKARRFSIIWLVPLLAVAIGAWLAWDTLSKQGPTIVITFNSAEGLQAGQSQLKFKEITLGTVKSLTLTPDHTRVDVEIATTKQAEPLLTDQTIFWVVKPRLFAGNLSGLDTVLSGSYVGMLPPAAGSNATPQRRFTGREEPPVQDARVAGRTFLLKADRLGSLSLGSPIFFRDLNVGEVLGWDIGDMAESVTIRAFVRAPYDGYVRDETRFWNASGVSLKMGANGVELQIESIRAIILGGLAFDTPPEGAGSPLASASHVFPLFSDKETAYNASYSRKVSVVSYFDGSVRGLAAGSEVTMHGLKVGTVTDVRLSFDMKRMTIVAPVRYEIEPERILGIGGKTMAPSTAAAAQMLVNQGMRATLQAGNLLTGSQVVALDFITDAPPAKVSEVDGVFVMPTSDGGSFAGLTASATQVLQKINALPLNAMVANINTMIASLTDLAGGQETKKILSDLASAMNSADELIRKMEAGLAPTAKQLPEVTADLRRTLTTTTKFMNSLQTAYGDNTRFSRDVDRLMLQVSDAVRSIRQLADLLSRHPEALIKGRPGGGKE